MKKIFVILTFLITLILPKSEGKKYDVIQDSFNDCVSIEVIINGNSETFYNGTKEYENILNEFKRMIEDSHQMPAFGVSIDSYTREEMEKGVWLEFKFKNVNYNSDMPFEALLVQVEKDFFGFNVIRKYYGKYDGRCFYISLKDKSMKKLYLYLVNL